MSVEIGHTHYDGFTGSIEFEAVYHGNTYMCRVKLDRLTGDPTTGEADGRGAFERRQAEVEKAAEVALADARTRGVVHQQGEYNQPITVEVAPARPVDI